MQGRAYLFPTSFNFGNNPSQTPTIDASTITNITNTGTDVMWQANNDITLNQAITTNNPRGNGGRTNATGWEEYSAQC
jgi:hypothetical protein